jgi:hypothetical protein
LTPNNAPLKLNAPPLPYPRLSAAVEIDFAGAHTFPIAPATREMTLLLFSQL